MLKPLIFWTLAITALLFSPIFWSKDKYLHILASRTFNTRFSVFLNWLLEPEAGRFGHYGEQTSSVIGKNMLGGSQANRKLFTAVGWPLNKLDKDHCVNAIQETL